MPMLSHSHAGRLAHRLTSPLHACPKEYLVSLAGPLLGHEAPMFASGRLQLSDGAVCLPALLSPHRTLPDVCRVTLWEGMYHQLRRMFAAVGHDVTGIHRTGFGGLRLADLQLQPGEWKQMNEMELETVWNHSRRRKPGSMAHGLQSTRVQPQLHHTMPHRLPAQNLAPVGQALANNSAYPASLS
jgi:pseudouridine synthase